jgi:hypothetical protein
VQETKMGEVTSVSDREISKSIYHSMSKRWSKKRIEQDLSFAKSTKKEE